MKLIIPGDSKKADAFLQVSWCIEPKDTEKILEKEIVDPHILFITAVAKPDIYNEGDFNWEQESREIIPIGYRTVYTTFNRPGEHRVFATIIGDSDGVTAKLRKEIKDAHSSRYVSRTGEFNPPEPYLGKSILDVYVPEEFFAPEPPTWEKWYMRLWFTKDLPTDQCDWRKRRIFAYTLMPFLLLIWHTIQLIIRIAVFGTYFIGGSRGVYFRPVWDHSEEIDAIYKHNRATLSNSIFTKDAKGNDRFLLRAAHPILFAGAAIVLGVSATATLVLLGYNYDMLWQMIKQSWIVLLIFLAAAGLIVLVLSYAFDKLISWWDKRQSSKESKYDAKKRRERERMVKLMARQKASLDLMACDRDSGGSLSSYQSVVLTFQGIKSKVCRPFRQSS